MASPKVFIKPVDPSKRQTKLLYVMGATWHNQCMFDLDTVEDSIADMLQKKHIETYAFDLVGAGPEKKFSVDNGHDINVSTARELVETYKIEYILGYSYGALVAAELVNNLPESVKGIILLDPILSTKPGNVTLTEDGLMRIINREQVAKDLIAAEANINEQVQKDYLDNLTDDNEDLKTARYPITVLKSKFDTIQQVITAPCRVRVCFTKSADESITSRFPSHLKLHYPTASHWILLENERTQLADDIENFTKE